ncbi:MAG: DUF748 domain-containing protein [Cycloclasticus sp.]
MAEKPKGDNEQMNKPSRWLKRLALFVVVLGLILSVLPLGIKFAIEKALIDAGSQQVSLEDVDINLFTGQFAVYNLKTLSDGVPALEIGEFAVGIEWLPLFNQQIVVNSLSLSDAFVSVEKLADNGLKLAGIKLPKAKAKEPSSDKSAWGFGLANVHIVDSRVKFKSPEFSTTAKIDDLLLAQLFSWKQGDVSDFTFDTYINGARMQGDLDLDLFAKTPTVKGTLKVNQLALGYFQSLVADSLSELSGKFSADIRFDLSLFENGIQYQQNGSVALTQSTVSVNSIQLVQEKLAWDGAIKVDTQLDDTAISVNGSISTAKVMAKSLGSGMMLVQFDALNVKQLSIEQLENISLSNVSVDALTVAKKTDKPLIELGHVVIDAFQLTNLADVEISNISLNDLQSDVQISKAGEVELLNELIANVQKKGSAVESEIDNQETLAVPAKNSAASLKIASVKVTGDSQINITSGTVSGSIKKEIALKRFELGELNNQRPNSLTPIVIEATINKHSTLSLAGNIAPFSDKVNVQLKTKLSAFELPDFSPLIRQELGYNIESGQLNADIKLDIKQNIIDGNTKVDIHGLVMQPADDDKVAKMAQQLSMPLDSALSLLRDGNDDILLEIPIRGDLAEPDFDIGDVINTALGNALQGTVKSFLKYALQPYGLIFMAAEKAYGAATSISLDAIEFAPGESTLSDVAVPYIVKIGELMDKRPGLRIRLCGVATPVDVLVIQQKEAALLKAQAVDKKQPLQSVVAAEPKDYKEALLVLAKERALAIKTKLASDFKVEATRLFNCLPSIATDNKKPRVDILI